MINIRSKVEVEKIAKAAGVVRDLLNDIQDMIKPGISTIELDQFAEKYITDRNAIPGFKGLYGFPATLCVSINDEVVHGIPSNRILEDGDIIGIDVGSIIDGFYGDHAKTFEVGSVSEDNKKLIDVTKECLIKGIKEAKPGNRIGDIGFAIQTYAESFGYGVVKELVGHGIGEKLHEEPQIPNYGSKNTGPIIEEGMCFAIEPMINFGSEEIYTKSDNWTVCTKDGSASAHFEHTITIDKDGAKILTI
tara:strand:+ start:929 stop:1672 length:744 start_codon:yes stop_codon:yes gene_type:complete